MDRGFPDRQQAWNTKPYRTATRNLKFAVLYFRENGTEVRLGFMYRDKWGQFY